MHDYLLIAAGGFFGANARYLVSLVSAGRLGTAFPYGTLIVNLSGSFLLGIITGILARYFATDPEIRLLIAIGFFGSYTTFSTFAFETAALVRLRSATLAWLNVLGNIGVVVSLAGLGVLLVEALVP